MFTTWCCDVCSHGEKWICKIIKLSKSYPKPFKWSYPKTLPKVAFLPYEVILRPHYKEQVIPPVKSPPSHHLPCSCTYPSMPFRSFGSATTKFFSYNEVFFSHNEVFCEQMAEAPEGDSSGWSAQGSPRMAPSSEHSPSEAEGWSPGGDPGELAEPPGPGVSSSDEDSWGGQTSGAGAAAPRVDIPPPALLLPGRGRSGRGRGRPRKRREPEAEPEEVLPRSLATPEDVIDRGIVAFASVLGSGNPDCRVAAGAVLRLQRGRVHEPPPLATAMVNAFFASQRDGCKRDSHMTTIAQVELGDAPVRMTSAQVAAEMASMSRGLHADRSELLAATCLQLQRSLHWLLQVSVLKHTQPESRLMYCEFSAYDETPMKVKSSGASSRGVAAEGQGVAPQGQLETPGKGGSTVSVWTPTFGEKTNTQSASTKILQHETGLGMLVEVGDHIFAVMTAPVTSLSILERTTARCIQAAILRGSFATTVVKKEFAHNCRVVVTDKASENFLAEKSIAAGHWDCNVHNPCDVHTLSIIFGKVLNGFVAADITGMIRTSLSLNVASQMNAFRRALREEIMSRLLNISKIKNTK